MKNEYQNLSLETVTNAIREFFEERESDDDIEPDLVINQDATTFYVTINKRLMTGYGGLKMYFNNFKDVNLIKISYNGVILNKEQKQELFNRVRYGK